MLGSRVRPIPRDSVAALRSIGISPDALILRCDRDVPEPLKNKIALMCDVDIDGVISTPDAPSIYDIPKVLHREELDAYVVRRLSLPFRDVDWTQWNDLLKRVHEPHGNGANRPGGQVHRPLRRLLVGRRGSAGGRLQTPRQGGDEVGGLSNYCETDIGATAVLDDVHGVLIPCGFGHPGYRGQDRRSTRYARQAPVCRY